MLSRPTVLLCRPWLISDCLSRATDELEDDFTRSPCQASRRSVRWLERLRILHRNVGLEMHIHSACLSVCLSDVARLP